MKKTTKQILILNFLKSVKVASQFRGEVSKIKKRIESGTSIKVLSRNYARKFKAEEKRIPQLPYFLFDKQNNTIILIY